MLSTILRDKKSLPITLSLSGFSNLSAQVYFITHTPLLQEKVVFWLTNSDESPKIFSLLKYWLKNNHPLWLLNQSKTTLLHQLLLNKPLFIISNFEDIDLPLPKINEFKKSILKISVNQLSSPAKLSQALTEKGYEFNRQVGEIGSFSRRGGIVDIHPLDSERPIRIEFLHNKINRICEFDFITKKTGKSINEIEIIPEQISKSEKSNIFEYTKKLKNLVFIYSDPEELKENYQEWPNIEKQIKSYPRIIFQNFGQTARQFDYKNAKYYHQNFNAFITDLKFYLQSNWRALLATNKQKEIKKLFAEKGLDAKKVKFLPFIPELSGFYSQKEKFLFITDREIFGEEAIREKTLRQKIDRAFIMELKNNDYVVHLDHGIAKFMGMARNIVEGIMKEYFVLEYANKDKLYVPVETAEKISKYIGLTHPKLHRLSGGNWYQITRKIKQEAKVLAQELLKIYAQRELTKTEAFTPDTPEEIELEKSFPYPETPDQKKAIDEVKNDLEKEMPMDRLICGDVGFGKTEVAIRAAFKAIMNKKQVALLSPTTILTQQHYDTFCQRLKKFPVNISILSRFQSEKEQKKTLEDSKSGLVDIVIGTHRLLSPDVKFKNLGLVIIDEEQKFGVRAKEKLKSLRSQSHILTLTATPIPRTLNLALSIIKDISIIETPPQGRLPIETIIEPHSPKIIKEAIENELKRKGQVYHLYNRVETINHAAEQIKKLLPKAKIGIAHGRLPEKELASIMQDFDRGKVDVLVCSTIIENGLDLPNVNTLIVDNATRFGLAQLYQLRGRIGRGFRQGYGYFLYHSHQLKGGAKKRLQAILEAKELGSGFQLALRDLEIRGAGNILGREQHGKVAAVGLSLYTRLLAQAVEELRTGKTQPAVRDISISLPLEAYIPKEFLPSEEQRLVLYQKMANLFNIVELRECKEKIMANHKPHSPLPAQLENLFQLLEIRILCQRTKIFSIDTVNIPDPASEKKKRVIIKFLNQLEPKKLEKLLHLNNQWHFTEDSIKLDLNNLGKDWVKELKKVIRIFEK